jgi:hypothetical protein
MQILHFTLFSIKTLPSFSRVILVEAGSKQLIDQTYFKGSMEYRGRCALLLEGALRTSVACRSYKLTKTIVEAVAMFKIGCYHTQQAWFDGVMQKTYQCLPRMEIQPVSVENLEGYPEIATADVMGVTLELTRLHAEAFTRQKIAMFQKQGIPPQIALQSYREGWWLLVRSERLEGDGPLEDLEIRTDGILQVIDKATVDKFRHEKYENMLLTAWPMMVQNVAQKTGKVKIQFLAPPSPGKYKFTITVKSQDFLGADQEFSVESMVVDRSTVERKPKEEPKEENVDGDKKDEDEAKKDK